MQSGSLEIGPALAPRPSPLAPHAHTPPPPLPGSPPRTVWRTPQGIPRLPAPCQPASPARQLWLRARRWVARWRRAWRQPCQGAGQPPIPR